MEEIYTLTIELESGMYDDSSWKRVIEISEETNLFELHLYIQKIIEFDNDHLFEFFVGKNRRKKERVFANKDEFNSGDEEIEGLDTSLNEIFPLVGSKLYYYFDFGDSWLFKYRENTEAKGFWR